MGLFDKLFGTSKRELQKQNLEQPQKEISNEIKNLRSRDFNKNPIYFSQYLSRIELSWKRTLDGFLSAQNNNNNNNKVGVKNWGRGLSEGIPLKISIWYSMGKLINKEWQDFYKKYVLYYQSCVDNSLKNGFFRRSNQIISIGILLEIEQEEFKKISERYVEEGYQDFILDSLVHSQYTQHPITEELQFPNETYIQKLAAIVKVETKEKAELIVKDALENHFYTKENLQIEYKSHKTEFYSGYWAWEIGALVKMLGLDDSSFNDNVYYPYDMVHWNDPKERSSFFVGEKLTQF